ncbi:protein-tyrosine phosphatase-like protein [Absidia repens]|uniref:protein-tyrosine-phosphatase n=1 Tax=Absidia repens TaxID=90262 RepID=A0A1X2I4U6_9FUNG|nr:protein-tyrosine phosphatase-like protein [Absidia repens]
MIPSTTLSTPPFPTHEPHKRSLSTNLSSAPLTSLAERRRSNKNLSLCLLPTDKHYPIPPSTPFLSTASSLQRPQQHYYQHGPIAILPGLYLGDEHNASNVQQLEDLSIHCVINVAAEVNHPYAQLFRTWDQPFLDCNTTPTATPCPTLSPSSSSSSSSSSINSVNSTLTMLAPSAKDEHIYSTMEYKKRPWHHHILDDDNDNDQQTIQKELHAAVMDVARARQSGRNVLVHCQCGLARSATVVVAYTMYALRLSMAAAILYVKKYAPHINPNLSLMYRLHEYELYLGTQSRQLDHTTMVAAAPVTTKKKLDTSASFLKTRQSSTLVSKCKSFKFKPSAASRYTTALRQDFCWRSSTSSK